ncbi:hypothetical protein BGZ83_011024 [Gryganskiella cystojenkinii]|nr:hypothetical protein BGZ83_011024 [Gryganskiella cystojenkinii]
MAVFSLALMAATLMGAMAAPVTHTPSSSIAVAGKTYSGLAILPMDHSASGACPEIQYSSSDNFVTLSADRFGSTKKDGKNLCGAYVKVNRADSPNKFYSYRVVDVCEDCVDDSMAFSLGAIRAFSNSDSVDIDWTVAGLNADDEDDKKKEKDEDKSLTQNKNKKGEDKSDVSEDDDDNKSTGNHEFHGRGTWFSDTSGSCGEHFSQDDMIVALNEAQQGQQFGSESKCGQKIRVSAKGSDASVVVRVVDTCPHRYCSHGQLDLSQAAFKKFANLSKGVLELTWSFV